MARPGETIHVEGLREFAKDLKRVDSTLPKALRSGLKNIAEGVAEKARSSFAGGPGVAPKVAKSVRALSERDSASIRIGGNAYPFAMGAEFGSVRFAQFPAWRGSGGDAGYHLYPNIRNAREHIGDDLDRLVTDVTKAAFPD